MERDYNLDLDENCLISINIIQKGHWIVYVHAIIIHINIPSMANSLLRPEDSTSQNWF